MKRPVKAVIYVKKNLHPENMDASAIASQFQAIIEYAFKNNIQIIKSYCDVVADGSKLGPELQNMLNEINDDTVKPAEVICIDFNKFGSDFGLYHKVKSAMDSKNIKMISVNKTDRKYFELLNSMH